MFLLCYCMKHSRFNRELTAAQRASFVSPLRAATIAAAAAPVVLAAETALQTGSTNADLMARARVRAIIAPLVRATLHQSAGRGRLGRSWQSEPGSALLFSVALPLVADTVVPAAATLACGVALCEALRAEGIGASLKWPNDIEVAGCKLAGVLTELALDGAGARSLVVGVGLNLWASDHLRANVGRPIATLDESIARATLAADREDWIGRLAAACVQAVRQFERDGFVPFQPRFMARFAALGQTVDVAAQGARIASGRALGVDGEGRLLLHVDGAIRAFSGGEISLRIPAAAPAQGVAQ